MSPLAEVLGFPAGTLEGLVKALKARQETVATAESLTAGLVCAALTSVPGSSTVSWPNAARWTRTSPSSWRRAHVIAAGRPGASG
jgi:hypothetical protein